ncbi:cytochrome c biogenesis CcdA family protein [Chthonobacter rhizosphaerae]|uniref:cytochrome c biogenesis CcdA family protein n=1 Tax=Chthonobacter rhizosphaerae TaxID=2735553 RepID=UPI0015EEB5C1|nr:cytochrome c biogenesis protein CcdA [Chthonobacter rhizosphaerae]
MTSDVTLLAAFGAGLISFVSPCVLPLVPPYLGFLAGATIEELTDPTESRRVARLRVVAVAAAFVLGFATVFITLGATASVMGQLIARHSMTLATIAGVVIILMGLHFLGVFRLAFLYREARFQAHGAKAGPMGAYVMGLAFAFGWTPCIGPILATILTVAGSRETVGEGAFLLGVYSAGLGVPFILSAFFAGPFMAFLKRFRAHFDRVEKVMGAVLVVTGVMFLTGQMQTISFWLLETFPTLATLG